MRLLFQAGGAASPTSDGGLDEIKRVLSGIQNAPQIDASQVLIWRITQVSE
jgi:hypothetical protein